MPFDVGRNLGKHAATMAGDRSGWPGGVATPTVPVTDLRPHVEGGNDTSPNPDGRTTLYWSAGIVLAALLILWASGSLAFRGASL